MSYAIDDAIFDAEQLGTLHRLYPNCCSECGAPKPGHRKFCESYEAAEEFTEEDQLESLARAGLPLFKQEAR